MTTTAKFCGFIGTVCLQGSALPALVQALETGETAPASSVILVLIGLIACLVQEINVKLWAYVVGSILGILGQAAILFVIAWRHFV